MIFRQVPVGTFQNFAYVIGDEKTGIAAVIDPAWEVDRLLRICSELELKVSFGINTHSHNDHVEGNDMLVNKTGAKIIAHVSSPVRKDVSVKQGDVIEISALRAMVIHTPGHCPDHICLLIDGKLLTGDTLFVGECGRTDLPGGNARDMYDSLFNKIMKLDDGVEIYPGHNYGPKTSSTIRYERNNNYTLKKRSVEEFVQFMAEP